MSNYFDNQNVILKHDRYSYRETTEQCQECFGRGEVEVDDDELHAKLYSLYHDQGFCAKLLFAVYRLWKIHPYTTCDMCNGHGEITRRF